MIPFGYRNRDKIEKDIDSLKNQIDGKRLRAHNKYTSNGRLFVKFIASIQHSKIMNIIKNDEKLKKYSLCEIMSELKKLKRNYFDENNTFLSELTKKQKLIFKAFNVDSINKFLVINFKFILGCKPMAGLIVKSVNLFRTRHLDGDISICHKKTTYHSSSSSNI